MSRISRRDTPDLADYWKGSWSHLIEPRGSKLRATGDCYDPDEMDGIEYIDPNLVVGPVDPREDRID